MNRLGKPVELNIWPMRRTSMTIDWYEADIHYSIEGGLPQINRAFFRPHMNERDNNPYEWSLKHDPR